MDYLQYLTGKQLKECWDQGFKPYYKWITFNTTMETQWKWLKLKVLNLIINGLPSILCLDLMIGAVKVLNLIINGLPSIQEKIKQMI